MLSEELWLDGCWKKFKYDEHGNEIYYESSNEPWRKNEYDQNSNKLFEVLNYGTHTRKYTVVTR